MVRDEEREKSEDDKSKSRLEDTLPLASVAVGWLSWPLYACNGRHIGCHSTRENWGNMVPEAEVLVAYVSLGNQDR
jgi:hypothetical protein